MDHYLWCSGNNINLIFTFIFSELENLKRDMNGSVNKMTRRHNQKNFKLQSEHRGKNWWMIPKPRQGKILDERVFGPRVGRDVLTQFVNLTVLMVNF